MRVSVDTKKVIVWFACGSDMVQKSKLLIKMNTNQRYFLGCNCIRRELNLNLEEEEKTCQKYAKLVIYHDLVNLFYFRWQYRNLVSLQIAWIVLKLICA